MECQSTLEHIDECQCSPCSPTPQRAQFKLGETNRQGTVAMAALGAPTACFFHTKIPLPIIAATPKSPSSPCKCVTVMGNLGTTVRNCQSPSAQLKLVRQSEVKKTQPYAFLNVENLRTRRTVHPRYKIFSNFPAILNHRIYIFAIFGIHHTKSCYRNSKEMDTGMDMWPSDCSHQSDHTLTEYYHLEQIEFPETQNSISIHIAFFSGVLIT